MLNTFMLMAVVAVAGFAYLVRVAVWGRVQYERIDRDGGSLFLGKSFMEMGYWTLQPVGKAFLFLRITPNTLTWISLVLGFASAVYLGFGRFGTAAIFAVFSFLLDSLDGMVARLSGVASDAGELLDASVDRYVEFFFISGLVIYYHHIPVMQGVALLALLGSFMVSYSTAKAEALQVEAPRGVMRRAERGFYLTLGAALSPLSISWFETPSLFFVPVGYPMVISLGMVGIFANVSAIRRLWAIANAVGARQEISKK